MKGSDSVIIGFKEIDKTKLALVGGKGANLGELSNIKGINVPDGFCISTEAFKRTVYGTPKVRELLDQLALLKIADRDKIKELTNEIRKNIEQHTIPQDIQDQVTLSIQKLGKTNSYAVRSSATAEDLPTTSFAGQQDTFLNIRGVDQILKHISKCWASLFTERAVIYRIQNGFDHRKVLLSVVVQKMVFPQVSGVMFTADPVTGNRKMVSIDASFGLGEALVSGMVNPDNYKVRNGNIIARNVSTKKIAIYGLADGGTGERGIEPEHQNQQALTDTQILQLERIGRTIETYFGSPQDIEWCAAEGTFYIVQSRPITTLFPIPTHLRETELNDLDDHIYLSVGHQQMMTDPMKPLGLSFFLLTTLAPMRTAGGRLFVDVAPMLASPANRKATIDTLGKFDPLIKDALTTLIERGDFLKTIPDDQEASLHPNNKGKSVFGPPAPVENDPAIVSELIKKNQASIERLKHDIEHKSGSDLLDFILEDIRRLQEMISDPQSMGVIFTGINASSWVNERMMEWLGEKNVADTLSQSVSDNITSEMGLALLDVADVIRPHPKVIEYLERVTDNDFLAELEVLNGGRESKEAIIAYLNKYGMRCVGEIDITRTRWSEKPSALLPLILSNIKNFEPGAGKRKFDQGLREALTKEQELITRLKLLPDGEQKASEAQQKISVIRNFGGYREYPKYRMVSRYFIYKQALLKEAEALEQAKVIHKKEDIYYLTFEELRDAVRTHEVQYDLINRRKNDYRLFEKLTPPRVITSDGEIITGNYKYDNLPAGAIAGLAVSTGVIEGRARVILNIQDADLGPGDILVTTFTDPSWTPLFVLIKGLVTEVGGLMTHGAVIAREYGLPAVVGVENATKTIKDGQWIRVNGTEGFVEMIGNE